MHIENLDHEMDDFKLLAQGGRTEAHIEKLAGYLVPAAKKEGRHHFTALKRPAAGPISTSHLLTLLNPTDDRSSR